MENYTYYADKSVGYWNHSVEQNGDGVVVNAFFIAYKPVPAFTVILCRFIKILVHNSLY